MTKFTNWAAAASLLIAVPAIAQQGGMQSMDHSKMGAMDHSKMMNDPGNPYGPAEMNMHQKMMAAKAGDASEIWTRKMIEHHRGAVAMSQIALKQAKNAETRQMASMTITKQQKEIAELQGWLKKNGKRPQ
jgi:uncharacterized protein (DUF305 family)|tara:strand:+ start:12844 stop:13236 length:393 start_codon:yes stop_codon:yes gene_type:complete